MRGDGACRRRRGTASGGIRTGPAGSGPWIIPIESGKGIAVQPAVPLFYIKDALCLMRLGMRLVLLPKRRNRGILKKIYDQDQSPGVSRLSPRANARHLQRPGQATYDFNYVRTGLATSTTSGKCEAFAKGRSRQRTILTMFGPGLPLQSPRANARHLLKAGADNVRF